MSPIAETPRLADRGFTLFEVLVSLAVLGLLVAVVTPVISQTARRVAQAPARLALATTGYDLLARLPARGDLRVGVAEGDIGSVHWRRETREAPYEPRSAQPVSWRPYEVVMDLSGPYGVRTRLETIRLGRERSAP